jgi:hypothetical protein
MGETSQLLDNADPNPLGPPDPSRRAAASFLLTCG